MSLPNSSTLAAPSSGRTIFVVATDFSETADAALERVLTLASGQEIHIVCVRRNVVSAFAAEALSASALLADSSEADPHELEVRCKRAASHARVYGHVRVGDPAVEIAQHASDVSADYVVVGTHGRTGVSRLLLGSVAEQVVRLAPCPVLVVKPKRESESLKIEPPCPQCLETRKLSSGEVFWCQRHQERHPRPHVYHAEGMSYGLGAQTFRSP